MKRFLFLALVAVTLPFLMGDMVTLKNGKTYKGLVFSEDGDTLVKIMVDGGAPVYVNGEHVDSIQLDPMSNREDKVEVARAKDALRMRDREYLLLKEAYDRLLEKYEKNAAELEALKAGGAGGKTPVPAFDGPFIKLNSSEVKRSTDALKITGVLTNEGTKDARTAELLVHLRDEDGIFHTLRVNALGEGKVLSAGATTDFEVKQDVAADLMRRLTSIQVDAVNESE